MRVGGSILYAQICRIRGPEMLFISTPDSLSNSAYDINYFSDDILLVRLDLEIIVYLIQFVLLRGSQTIAFLSSLSNS